MGAESDQSPEGATENTLTTIREHQRGLGALSKSRINYRLALKRPPEYKIYAFFLIGVFDDISIAYPLFFMLNFGVHASHWEQNQVQQYVHHSELQRRSTWQLLSRVTFNGNERVLDIGCGDGRNTAWISRLARNRSVIGVDPSPAMIEWAKKQYDEQEFSNLRFEMGDYFEIPTGSLFDVITSFFSLHIVSDKKAAIQNVYENLEKGGKFICVVPPTLDSNPEYLQAFGETVQDPKWKPFFTQLKPSFLFVGLDEYKDYLKKAGFKVKVAQFVPSVDPFVNQTEFVNWVIGTWPHIHYLPRARWEEFVTDILHRYKDYRPEAFSDDGVVRGFWGRIELIAEKL